MSKSYPCPCCGHFIFDGPPGGYDICPICDWEDDIVQLGFPLMAGGANKGSLFESQQEFVRSGASDLQSVGRVRRPNSEEPIDPMWRPFDPVTDAHLRWDSPEDEKLWHDAWNDVPPDSRLYYWRPDYWLSQSETNGEPSESNPPMEQSLA